MVSSTAFSAFRSSKHTGGNPPRARPHYQLVILLTVGLRQRVPARLPLRPECQQFRSPLGLRLIVESVSFLHCARPRHESSAAACSPGGPVHSDSGKNTECLGKGKTGIIIQYFRVRFIQGLINFKIDLSQRICLKLELELLSWQGESQLQALSS